MTHRPYTPPAWQAKPLADGRVTLLVVPLRPASGYQSTWLSPEILQAAPSCYLIENNGRLGAQMRHPKANKDNPMSPLTWVALPYSPGDLIWCREKWRIGAWETETCPRLEIDDNADVAVDYIADNYPRREWLRGNDPESMLLLVDQSREDAKRDGRFRGGDNFPYQWPPGQSPCRIRPAVTMPKWATRTWLRCTGVDVRRVQTISEDEAWAVGCPKGDPTDNGGWFPKEELQPDGSEMGWDCPEDWVADKWDEQYALKPRKRAGGTLPPKPAVDLSFDANPWAAFTTVEKISKEDV
jgi:hypothetical protein